MRICKNIKKDFFKIFFYIFVLFALINISGCNIVPEQPVEVENHPPNILSEPLNMAYVGEKYTYQVDALDIEEDVLIYSLTIKPQGMIIDSSNGAISWTPLLSQLGENNVEVKVSDNNLFETQSFVITVYKNDGEEEETQLSFIPYLVDVALNSTVEIGVKVENILHLRGASITLHFDANKLKYDSSTNNNFIPNATLMEQIVDNNNGNLTLDIAGLGIDSYISGSGTLFTITFNAIASGKTSISFNASELRDKENNSIDHVLSGGCQININ